MSDRIKPQTTDKWFCNDCQKSFSIQADFGDPTFCPNCGSQNIRKKSLPDDPNRPNDPRPPEYFF